MNKKLDLKLYLVSFNAITTAIEELEKSAVNTPQTMKALEILKNAQITTEEIYIDATTEKNSV